MTQELFYTSVPAGLKPGTSGFCVVAETAGISTATTNRLKSLSGYQEVYPPGSPHEEYNPVAYCHWRLEPGDRASSVLSRVCPAGMDYSGRSNTFAHHLILDVASQPPGGPAMVMSRQGTMETRWTGEPRTIPYGRAVATAHDPPGVCQNWAAIAGDAGWAGILAATAAGDTPKVAYIIFTPGQEMLPLIREAMALLGPKNRWRTCFSTYFTELPGGMTCHWRCCVTGTAAAKEARRFATSGVVIDFTQKLGAPPDEPLVHTARTGEAVPAGLAEARQVDEPKPDRATFTRTPRVQLRPKAAARTAVAAVAAVETIPAFADEADAQPDTSLGEYHPEGPRRPAAKPKIWLWILAFVWPLLVIPAVVAWHVTAESQRNRDLARAGLDDQKQLADAEAKAKVQHNNLADLTTQTEDLKQKLQVATSQASTAEKERDDVQKQLEQSSDLLTKAEKSVEQYKAEIQTLKNKPAGSKTARPIAPAPAPAPKTELATGLIDPLSDLKVLASPVPAFDHLELVNLLNDNHITAVEKHPLDKPLRLELHYSADGTGAATSKPSQQGPQIGVIENDPQYGLVWISKLENLHDQDLAAAKSLLHECGVNLFAGKELVGRFQFGVTTGTFFLAKNSLQLVPAGSHLPDGTRIEATDLPNWVWKSNNPAGTELRFELAGSPEVNFLVSLNLKTGELSSDFNSKYKPLADAVAAAKATVEADNAKEAFLAKTEGDAQAIKDSAAKEDAITKHNVAKKECDANLAVDKGVLSAAADAKAKYDGFSSCRIKVLNPNNGMLLKLVTMSK